MGYRDGWDMTLDQLLQAAENMSKKEACRTGREHIQEYSTPILKKGKVSIIQSLPPPAWVNIAFEYFLLLSLFPFMGPCSP